MLYLKLKERKQVVNYFVIIAVVLAVYLVISAIEYSGAFVDGLLGR
jgi:hypothetical protein